MSNTAHHKGQLSPLERRSFEMMTIAELERKQMKRLASKVKHAARRRILAERFIQSLQKAGVEFPRAQFRSELERRPHTRPAPTFRQPVPTFDPTDSNVRFPPYDADFTSGTGGDVEAAANKVAGTASFFAEGKDGLRFVNTYLGIWVQAAQDNRFARFAALIDYSYSWEVFAVNASAHSGAGPLFNVFGYTEQTQVGLKYVDPQWEVVLSGFPGDAQADSDEEGRISDEVIFPVIAGSFYLVWVQLGCSVQDDGDGFLYGSYANAYYSIRVPLTVFQNVAT